MVSGIIEYDGSHTISKLNALQIDSKDISNDIKFLRDTDWSCEDVQSFYREYLKNFSGISETGFLIIDDTVVEKQGKPKKIEGLGWHYSHTKGRAVYGHSIVTSHYRIGKISFPYDFRFYLNEDVALKCNREFKTKPEIACDMINGFKQLRSEKIYCLVDSWYTSEKVIKSAKSRDFEVVGALKSNRVFQFREHGEKHKLSTYVKNLRNTSFEKILFKDEVFKVRRIEAWLKGIGKVAILISVRVKDGSKMFILSTDLNLSTEEIMKYYSYRWDIETGYLYCKDRLGLGHYQMRKLKAIEKYCALVFAAYALLESLRVSNNEQSLGKSRQYFKMMKKRKYVDQVIDLHKKGVSKRDIYKTLKLVA
ncbi:MAG: IS701 family transposase [Fibrobacter sp.]|nr:IS701 family transposase [Fibrobacter sp.]